MIIEQILNNLKNCDDFHNRCDYLLEHDEITYLLDYIVELKKDYIIIEQENKQLKDNWNKLKMYCYEHYYGITTIGILQKMEELERGDENHG